MDPLPRDRARKVKVTRLELRVDLTDGRTIIVPTYWYPRLLRATAKQRARYKLMADGTAIRWPAVDEDLSVEGLLQGNRAPQGSEFLRWKPLTRRKTQRRP